jgi:hypothetical protein
MKKRILFLFLVKTFLQAAPNAFCCVPVADLLSTSMREIKKQKSPILTYQDMPYYDIGYLCPRACQLLFNEKVEIIEQQGDEVKVRLSHLYYKTTISNKKQTYYWTQKKNIMRFSEISKYEHLKFPNTPSFTSQTIDHNNIITLTLPYKNTKTDMHFSAGTRFIKNKKQKRAGYITTECFNPKTKQSHPFMIPEKMCEWGLPTSAEARRKVFISQLKSWAHPVSGKIPYVFGGASIQTFCEPDLFTCKRFTFNDKKKRFYLREKSNKEVPAAGIDCSHLVSRAAHIAGIPYFLKNTTTIIKDLNPLTKKDTIEDGDLLVWNGHVAIISDKDKGLLIEARAYNHGYGIVHEIPFDAQFKDIKTITQLEDAYFNKKQITRLGKSGKKVGTIYDLQIMKFPIT